MKKDGKKEFVRRTYNRPLFRFFFDERLGEASVAALTRAAQLLAQYCLNTMRLGNISQYSIKREIEEYGAQMDVHAIDAGTGVPIVTAKIRIAEEEEEKEEEEYRVRGLFLTEAGYIIEPNVNVNPGTELLASVGNWRRYAKPESLPDGFRSNSWATKSKLAPNNSSYATHILETYDDKIYVCGYGGKQIVEITDLEDAAYIEPFYSNGSLVGLASSGGTAYYLNSDGEFAAVSSPHQNFYGDGNQSGMGVYGDVLQQDGSTLIHVSAGGSVSLSPISTEEGTYSSTSDGDQQEDPIIIVPSTSPGSYYEDDNGGVCSLRSLTIINHTDTIEPRTYTQWGTSSYSLTDTYSAYPWAREMGNSLTAVASWSRNFSSQSDISSIINSGQETIPAPGPPVWGFCVTCSVGTGYGVKTRGAWSNSITGTESELLSNVESLAGITVKDRSEVFNCSQSGGGSYPSLASGVTKFYTLGYGEVMGYEAPYFVGSWPGASSFNGKRVTTDEYSSIQDYNAAMRLDWWVETTKTYTQDCGYHSSESQQSRAEFKVMGTVVDAVAVPSSLEDPKVNFRASRCSPITADLCFVFYTVNGSYFGENRQIWGYYQGVVTDITSLFNSGPGRNWVVLRGLAERDIS